MADDPDPPRKFYRLKPTEFERVNQTPPPAPSVPSAAAALPPAPAASARIDVRELAREASAGTPILGVNEAARRPTDVHAILQQNLDAANAAGLNDVTPPAKRRSRRLRDYLLFMIPVNAFFAWWAFGPGANATTFVYGIGGMAFFSAGFTWVMFFVLDDY